MNFSSFIAKPNDPTKFIPFIDELYELGPYRCSAEIDLAYCATNERVLSYGAARAVTGS